jgi:hypothetical protein
MLAIWRDETGQLMPTEAREEVIFELAQLTLWLQSRIVDKNTESVPIAEVDPIAERAALDSAHIRERLENIARNLVQGFWKPFIDKIAARNSLIIKPSALHLSKRQRLRVEPSKSLGVRRQHYSPAFANKHWASGPHNRVRVYSRGIDQRVRSKDVGYSTWAREKFLYSQRLEKLFHLIEGDAKGPYTKLLQVIPLNEKDRRCWIAYLIAQQYRTPRAIRWQLAGLKRLIARDRLEYPTDIDYLRRAYETLFTNNKLFAHFYTLMMSREWHIWRSPPGSQFIRSDEPITTVGSSEGNSWQLIYPLTPERCFAVGPEKAPTDTALQIVPSGRELADSELWIMNRAIARSARLSVIGRQVDNDQVLVELLQSALGQVEAEKVDLEQSLIAYWGSI